MLQKSNPYDPKRNCGSQHRANNPTLKRYVDCEAEVGKNIYGNHWNNPSSVLGRQVCVHAFIGYDKNNKVRVANILPYNMACWGVGGGSKGSFNYDPVGHIQFEMCEDGLTDKTYFNSMWETAVEYCVYLCEKFGFDPLGKNVIVSHKESCDLGYGSNHGDPHNWFVKHGKTMDDFRAAVKAKLDAAKPVTPAPVTTSINEGDLVKIASNATYYSGKAVPSWVKNKNWYVQGISGDRAVIDKSEDGKNSICSPINSKFLSVVGAASTPVASFTPYLVKVTADVLNIRKGAGTNYTVTGSIRNKGVYTIVEESNGWGKLKSGAGWISLAYTKKV